MDVRVIRRRLLDREFVAHVARSYRRFVNRLGGHLAASIAFFTMLALMPVLMFMVSAAGFILTVIRPDWLGNVQAFIVEHINAGPLQDQVLLIVSNYLYNWRGTGIVALAIAIVVGTTWVMNMRMSIRAITQPDFGYNRPNHNLVVEMAINVGLVFVLMILVVLTFTANAAGTQLAGKIVGWLRLSSVEISEGLVRVASLGISFAAAAALFYLLFRFGPEDEMHPRAVWRGCLIAASITVVLQALAGLLTTLFALGKTSQIFGPVIVAMLVINLFAQVMLFCAAWVATWNQPAVARRYAYCDEILRDRADTLTSRDHWIEADREKRERNAARRANGAS